MKRIRVAFALASIDEDSNTYLKCFSSLALRDDAALVVFPGGRLNHIARREYLDNPIYSYVDRSDSDCLISWASSLGGTANLKDITEFHKQTFRTPFITLAHKIKGHADYSFMAYSAMKEEILHLIDVHKKRRIAFLRGPETHKSAEERYLAYCAVLKLRGMSVDPSLVSSSVQWHDWEAPIRELVEERGLVPGVDFDSIVCVNDDVMYSSVEYLSLNGYSVPDQVAVVGFNDSIKASLMPVPGTTIEIPIRRISEEAWAAALSGRTEEADSSLPCVLKIRRSCGCSDSFYDMDKGSLNSSDPAQFASIVSTLLGVTTAEVLSLMAAESSLSKKDYLNCLKGRVEAYIRNNLDIHALLDVFELYQTIYASSFFRIELAPSISSLIVVAQNKIRAELEFHQKNIDASLFRIKETIAVASDFDGIIPVLAKELPLLGIEEFHLVFFKNESVSEYVGGFSGKVISPKALRFSSSYLLPSGFALSKAGTYMVVPIHDATSSVGYFIVYGKTIDCHGVNELKLLMNLSVSTVRRHSEAVRMVKEVETERKEKHHLVTSILSDVERMEMEGGGNLLPLLERIRLGYGGEGVSRTTCSLNEVLDEHGIITPQRFPVVIADRRGLALMIGRPISSSGVVSVALAYEMDGFTVTLALQSEIGREDLAFIAEEMKSNGGRALAKGRRLDLFFPYPNLYGDYLQPGKKELVIVDKEEEGGITLSSLIENGIPEDLSTVRWKASFYSHYAEIVLDLLRESRQNISICSQDIPSGYPTVAEALSSIRSEIRMPLLYHNLSPELISHFGNEFECMPIESRNDLAHLMIKASPDLVLINGSGTLFSEMPRDAGFPIVYFGLRIPDSILEESVAEGSVLVFNAFLLSLPGFPERLARLLYSDSISPKEMKSVKTFIRYVNRFGTGDISRDVIADEAGVCPDYLTTIVRKVLGLPPSEYLNRYRLEIARELLQESDMALKEVASESGFRDAPYFCKMFKKSVGLSPNNYRKEYNLAHKTGQKGDKNERD